jgi:hypothetical protein
VAWQDCDLHEDADCYLTECDGCGRRDRDCGPYSRGRQTDFELLICEDCVVADANGAEAVTEPDWPGLPDWYRHYLFGPAEAGVNGERLEPHFSYSSCELCGSSWAGSRFHYQAVPKHRREV